jgi:murein DD-endopeptidase MepM/ murein hydrolase activator NlpD
MASARSSWRTEHAFLWTIQQIEASMVTREGAMKTRWVTSFAFLASTALLTLLPSVGNMPATAQGSGITERVSIATNTTQGNNISDTPRISGDGRYVVFESFANNLVSGDTNNIDDIFVRDRQTGQTSRVSIATNGSQGNGSVDRPAISGDGRYVTFESRANNLVSGDTNGMLDDIFVHDRQTGQTSRVSVATDGSQENGTSDSPAISGDGRYVAFESDASNLVSGDTNGATDIFVHDRQTAQTSRVSVATNGAEGNGFSYTTSISGDGRYVAFESGASNLVSGDTNGFRDIFVHDQQTNQTSRVSVATNGTQGNGLSFRTAISGNGRYVAFASNASNLVSGDTNGFGDVFVHGQQTGQTSRVSVATNGAEGNALSDRPTISADGRYVAFESSASNLVSGDTNGFGDVFVHNRQTSQTSLLSVGTNGIQGNGRSYWSSLSGDGRYVAFGSGASNLVSGDTNGVNDIFVHDQGITSGCVNGRVVDSVTGQGIPDVHIALWAETSNAEFYPTTNATGDYKVDNMPIDQYLGWATRDHFYDRKGWTIQVSGGTCRRGDFQMDVISMEFVWPLDQIDAPKAKVTSWFDHRYPIANYGGEPVAEKDTLQDYTGQLTYKSYSGHEGIDVGLLASDTGRVRVVAAATGVITRAIESASGFGNHIVIDHGNGILTLYGHLSRFSSPVITDTIGITVIAGQEIGRVGYSGHVIPKGPGGTHLHFGVYRYFGSKLTGDPSVDYVVDPCGWLPRNQPDPWVTYDRGNHLHHPPSDVFLAECAPQTTMVPANIASSFTSQDGNVSINMPAGATNAPLVLRYVPVPVGTDDQGEGHDGDPTKPRQPMFPTGLIRVGPSFFLDAYTLLEQIVSSLHGPVTLVLHYGSSDVNQFQQHVQQGGIQVYRLDQATGAWIALPTSLGPSPSTITAQTTVFGQFAVLASDQAHLYIPLITK